MAQCAHKETDMDEISIEVPLFDPDDDEFACPECGENLDDEEECVNPECPCFGEEPSLAMSDWEERQHERKQMGVGL